MKVITIGRSLENNIVINDLQVSRTHMQLVYNDNGICSVVDLNSVNGTFVNGQKITGEVRLYPNDTIRIGNTELPWQSYILKPSSNAVVSYSHLPVEQSSKTKRTGVYIVVCVIIFILLAGGITAYISYYNGKQQENIAADERNQEEIKKEQLRQEAEQKAEEAKRLQEEADELFRQALISQSDKSKALAEAKQKEATEAKKQAEAATAAQRKAESARIAAEKAKEEANIAKVTAEQNSKKAIQNAEEKAIKAISQANTERDSAHEKAQLTEEFYEEYATMKADFAKQVCRHLKYELPKDKIDAKTAIKDLFNASDNKGKQAIVAAIHMLKEQNSKIKSNEPEIKSDSLESVNGVEVPGDNCTTESDE